MILHVSPGSPWWAFAGANAILFLHIAAGSMGLVSGAVALSSRKGERLHRLAGTVFVVSMLIMAAIGAGVSPFLPVPQPGNVLVGTLTFYLVATSWVTIRRNDGGIGRFEIGGFFVALIIAAGAALLARKAASSPTHTIGGQPMQVFCIFALAAAMCAAFDLKVILKGGISGAPRIARHLWRMCLALTSASVSFFLGQQKFFPAALHGSPLLFVPVLAPLVLMVFWLIRVRLTNRFKNEPVAA